MYTRKVTFLKSCPQMLIILTRFLPCRHTNRGLQSFLFLTCYCKLLSIHIAVRAVLVLPKQTGKQIGRKGTQPDMTGTKHVSAFSCMKWVFILRNK